MDASYGALPSQPGHLPPITGVRGAAALLIVVFHMFIELSRWGKNPYPLPGLRFGWVGVDLFFVLSGFLLAWVLWSRREGGRQQSYGGYVAQRSLRIVPTYYVALLATMLMLGLMSTFQERPLTVLLHLLLLQMFDASSFGAVNPLYWTLAVELQFYLVLPFLLPLFAGRRWPVALLGALVLTLAWRWWFYRPETLLYMFYLPAFLFHFALGVGVARLVIDGRLPRAPVRTGLGALVLLVALPLVALIPPSASSHQAYNTLAANVLVRPLVAVGFALLIWSICSTSAWSRVFSWRPLLKSGDWSYSIYLIHVPILLQLRHFPSLYQGAPWLYLLTGMAASVMGGVLLYRLVESPVNRFRVALRRGQVPPASGRANLPSPLPAVLPVALAVPAAAPAHAEAARK